MALKYGPPHPEFIGEARRIVDAAKSEGILLRLLGALAFNIHCPKYSYVQETLGRSFTDIDFASYRKQAPKISKLFSELGYQEDLHVTALFGANRMIFYDKSGSNRHCDVFLDKLEFCHDVIFRDRLEIDEPTIPLVELLLEKMQIVEINEKDLKDAAFLIRTHDIGESDTETINGELIAKLLSQEWGFCYTVTMNLDKLARLSEKFRLTPEERDDVRSKVEKLKVMIESKPKSVSWKMRARIGPSKKWYNDVEAYYD